MNGELKGNVLSGDVSGEQTLQGSGYPRGDDGISPVVEVSQIDGGYHVKITDKEGVHEMELMHGKPGKEGQPGKDGMAATHSWDGTVLTVTSASGTSSADLKGNPGRDGNDGDPGRDGTSVSVASVAESTASGGSNVVTFTDGSRLSVKNGRDGSNGNDGVSPTHRWDGTILTISSASGTSSADLKGRTGDKGDKGEKGEKGEKGDKGDPFTYEDFTEEQIAALRQDRGCLFYSTETFPDADIGNGRTLSVDDISLEGRTIRVNDMVLSGDGLLWAVNYVGADGITGAQCIFNLRGAADAQGCSIYYSSKELNNAEIGKDYYLSISDIHLSNRALAKNDLIITADGHLFKVYLVREDSAGATCIGCLKGKKGDPGGVQTVNGVAPDANGNVQVETGMGGADWNAAKGEPAHVANRTHWVEGGMVEIPVSGMWENSSQYTITAPMGLEAGNTYTVVWNGVEYTATARNENIEGMSAVVIGNLLGESTEPFGIAELSAEAAAQMGMYGMACPYGGTSGFVDFTIYHNAEVVHKLPGKFLPDGVPYVEQGGFATVMPEITLTEDTAENIIASLPPIGLVEGDTYIINLNGTEYSCEAFTAELMPGVTCVVIGNPAFVGGADNGFPGVIVAVPPDYVAVSGSNVFMEIDVEMPFAVSVKRESVKVNLADMGLEVVNLGRTIGTTGFANLIRDVVGPITRGAKVLLDFKYNFIGTERTYHGYVTDWEVNEYWGDAGTMVHVVEGNDIYLVRLNISLDHGRIQTNVFKLAAELTTTEV